MGKYTKYQRKSPARQRGLNPVWRGIGCILLVLVPLLSCALASALIPVIRDTGKLPYQLFQRPQLPAWVFQQPVLRDIGNFVAGIDNFWGLVVLFLFILLLISGGFTLLYIIIYQRIGPSAYSALDSPTPRYKAKKYKR